MSICPGDSPFDDGGPGITILGLLCIAVYALTGLCAVFDINPFFYPPLRWLVPGL